MLRGGEPFSVDTLLRRAGAGVGTFYHHFPNGREDLRVALERQATEEFEASVMRVLQRNRDAETGIKALVHHQARWAAEQPELAAMLPQRPGADLLKAARAWVRSVGLDRVGADELIAVTLAPLRVSSVPERLAPAAWAAVQALDAAS